MFIQNNFTQVCSISRKFMFIGKRSKSFSTTDNSFVSQRKSKNLAYLNKWLGTDLQKNINRGDCIEGSPSSIIRVRTGVRYPRFIRKMLPVVELEDLCSLDCNDLKRSSYSKSNAVVLDFRKWRKDIDDMKTVISEFHKIGLQPVAAIYSTKYMDINGLPLPTISEDSSSTDARHLSENDFTDSDHEKMDDTYKNRSVKTSKTHDGNVRSGQQVYSEGGSLIVIGNIHVGGEVFADGDIHIYGRLQGRAVAGLSGSPARIYVTYFDPVLVGIGDAFMAPENYDELKNFKGKALSISRDTALNSDNHDDNMKIDSDRRVIIDCGEGKGLVLERLVW